MSAKRVRWVCPNGHPAVLGPRRPARDNVVRYCLRCSEATGRLVARAAPALERERATRRAAVEAKHERRREAARRKRLIEVREVDGTVGDLDPVRALTRMSKLPAIRELPNAPTSAFPWSERLTVRRSRAKPYSSGHAYTAGEITVTVAASPKRIEVEELLLHELVHVATPSTAHHGRQYRWALAAAARQWWPGIRVDPDVGQAYDLDLAIVAEATRVTSG